MKNMFSLSIAFIMVLAGVFPVQANNMFSCADVSEIPQIECEALVALYSYNGPEWYHQDNWLQTITPSNWWGVGVSESHVVFLHLGGNNIGGEIPFELANLTELIHLRLERNRLTSNIPPVLGSLSKLEGLILNSNYLTGRIPDELGNLTNLKHLYLYNNYINDFLPIALGNLTLLEVLYLQNNHLSGYIPPSFGILYNLSYLDLSGNQLSSNIPPELGNLVHLKKLFMGFNKLGGGIPPELGNLSVLNTLDLSNNLLEGSIPAEIGLLSNLHILKLQSNQLLGDIPSSFQNLTTLDEPGQFNQGYGLDLDYNLLYVPPGYPNPGDPLYEFLFRKDPDWHLYQGFRQVIGAAGGELTSQDGRTDILFPAGALITDTIFTYIPQPAPHHPTGMLASAHNSFELSAEDLTGTPVITFTLPATITLSYFDADILSIPESSLGLYTWDEVANSWVDAVTTCPGGVYTRDPDANLLILQLCHLMEFGLLGEPLYAFLPFIER